MTLNQTLISSTTLTTNSALVTIPVPSGYTDLRLLVSSRDTSTGDEGGNYYTIAFNGTGTMTTKYIQGNGSSVPSGGLNNLAGISTSSSSTANTFCNDEIYIPNYGLTGAKSYTVDTVTENNSTKAYATLVTGIWSGSGAITSITLAPSSSASFVAGSTFTIYGITKLGVTPTQTPKASGGDIVKNDGTYWYHAFLSTGQFIPQTTLSCDALVIAGGGGGGSWYGGGGGGAGGVIAAAAQSLTATNYTVTVGAGGAYAPTGHGNIGFTGSSSTLSSTTAYGGTGGYGYGYGDSSIRGGNSGSPQTNTGGIGYVFSGGYSEKGGGGAGAGGNGTNASTGAGGAAGNGGIGINTVTNWGSFSSVTSALNVGSSGYFAGGGGGGRARDTSSGSGGTGGGGNGAAANDSNGFPGVANTGGGGGGNGGNGLGGNGGSGIVIIRYAMA